MYFVFVFSEQEEKSSLSCLDLTFNDIQANGAQVLASSLQV